MAKLLFILLTVSQTKFAIQHVRRIYTSPSLTADASSAGGAVPQPGPLGTIHEERSTSSMTRSNSEFTSALEAANECMSPPMPQHVSSHAVAQWAARQICKLTVAGSSPEVEFFGFLPSNCDVGWVMRV